MSKTLTHSRPGEARAEVRAGAARPEASALTLSAEIDALLTASLEENRGLLSLAERHREALRRADGDAARACIEEQDVCLRRLADLDRRRIEVIGAFESNRRGQKSGSPTTITDLTDAVPEPDRTRLREKAATLKELMARIRSEYQTIQIATRSLLAHMEGLMRQIGRQLSHTGTYGRRGYVEPAANACAIDLTR